MKYMTYGEDEPKPEVDVVDMWFEKEWASGPACRKCGSQIAAGDLQTRHIAWHESMGQRPDGG